VCTYNESLYQLFKGGFQYLRDIHDNDIVAHKQWIAEEKVSFEMRRKKRPQGEWLPDSISGGSTAVCFTTPAWPLTCIRKPECTA